jgi:hypothetical protein
LENRRCARNDKQKMNNPGQARRSGGENTFAMRVGCQRRRWRAADWVAAPAAGIHWLVTGWLSFKQIPGTMQKKTMLYSAAMASRTRAQPMFRQ